jgi:hypothetical protein
MVCMTGSTNGTRCGEIKEIAASNIGSDYQAKVDTCGGPGDSGGPVYIKGQARGLIASTSNRVGPGGCSTYFQRARAHRAGIARHDQNWMNAIRLPVLASALAVSVALVAIGEAGDHWLPAEHWLDGRLRDAACSVSLATGNHCYEPSRPSSSSVPWALAGVSLMLALMFALLGRRQRTAVPRLTTCAIVLAMTALTLIVRSGGDSFGPLDRDWGPTPGDSAWALLALLSLFAAVLLLVRGFSLRELGEPET